jgi:2-polyprenyl-6-methoxyphenol hydroxylase-like FAD-dependent oxidoreductase
LPAFSLARVTAPSVLSGGAFPWATARIPARSPWNVDHQPAILRNFVAIIDRDSWQRESWTDRGDIADVMAAYDGWHPQVRAIIGAADEAFIWALFDRAPLPRWSVGRITLLGDACHPMLPFTGQGAAQAVEDGATLAACLIKSSWCRLRPPWAVQEVLPRFRR